MPNLHFPSRGGAHSGGGGPSCSADELIARAEFLIDVPQPYDGYPLEWHAEALNVGDLTAIAAAALRDRSRSDVPPTDA